MPSNGTHKNAETTRNEFGTFAGVFVPSILTILGIIMFTRTGFVVGTAGVKGALGILLICEVIVLLSALSISAIATNTPVRGGGAYYLISRVLGAEFGGSIGLALYFAQALSVPFYILGFTEALVSTWPVMMPYFSLIAVTAATVLFVVTYIGASWAIRAQYVVLAILALAIVSFLGGAWLRFDGELLRANWEPSYFDGHSFWSILAIYFPAVTGIMAGVNMSGDLKDPQRSLVRGTFAAIAVGFVIYAAEILLCGASQSRVDLVERPYEMLMRNALMGTAFLVAAGVFAATTSSALGSFLGAPRVLQALSRDRIFGFLRPFTVGSKQGDEPRRALGITFIITLLTLWGASGKEGAEAFNFVAAIVTMFFLCTYGIVNLAAFVESFGSNPSFRPRFRYFHWSTAFLGAAGCSVVMLLIDLRAAVVSVAAIAGLYVYVSRWVVTVAFGDARRGFVHASVTKQLLRLRYLKPHAKNWRPTILVLSGNPETRLTLMKYGLWLEAGRGIVSVTQLLSGDLGDIADRRDAALERLTTFIRTNNLNVFPEVVVSRTFDEGIRVLLQAHSIGPIKPNMVLMGWPKDPERFVPFVRHLRDIRLLGKSSLVVVDKGLPPPEAPRRIDVWWRGKENGSLMLILAYLLRRNWEWGRARIRVLREVENEAGRAPAHKALTEMVEAARIEAEVGVVVSTAPFIDILKQYSELATVVFLGFQVPAEEHADAFFARYEDMLAFTPTTILVNSSGEADLTA